MKKHLERHSVFYRLCNANKMFMTQSFDLPDPPPLPRETEMHILFREDGCAINGFALAILMTLKAALTTQRKANGNSGDMKSDWNSTIWSQTVKKQS